MRKTPNRGASAQISGLPAAATRGSRDPRRAPPAPPLSPDETQARRGQPAGAFPAPAPAQGRSQVPCAPGKMAAPIVAPGRALLRAAAERLPRGRVRALLRPPLEWGTSGLERDFSLSYSRVRAGAGLRDP